MKELILRGSARHQFLPSVWDAYQKTYRTIGMHIQSPQELLDYDRWDLLVLGEHVVSFRLWKSTAYGWKAGLSGHDGSNEGKKKAVDAIRHDMHETGFYGEVSHKVRDIALAAGTPVVCASLAGIVLGKNVTIVSDIEYQRQLGGLGVVTKTLVGRPRGVPTTTHKNPVCPISVRAARRPTGSDGADFGAHFACLALDDLDSPEMMADRVASKWMKSHKRV